MNALLLSRFEALLKQAIGLEASSIGSTAVQQAIDRRIAATGVANAEDYWQHLETFPTEVKELTEAIVVSETWFFRGREAFDGLARLVTEEWLPKHKEARMECLCIPCATGEEPYSIVMALRDQGIPSQRARVTAIDISTQCLERAKLGIYGKNSFRGKDLDFRDRYFKDTGRGFLLSPAIREQVIFEQGNVLDPLLFPPGRTYDYIFCRNLLIYFAPPTQTRVIRLLGQMLDPDGVLFVGPAESNLAMENAFVSARISGAFAFRKAGAVQRAQMQEKRKPRIAPDFSKVKTMPTLAQAAAVPRAASKPIVPVQSALAPAPVAATAPPVKKKTDLTMVKQLADSGQLKEAESACELYLKENGDSAEGYYLLGLVRDAAGDRLNAVACYRKTLYLQPSHYEALMHLAYLSDKAGDSAAAQLLRKRAERVKSVA